MTISQTTVNLSAFTTDAKFRAWSLATATALLGAGLTQTADTGQINHVTVTRPVAANTSAGYEIWRFNDGLQGAFPIFMKVEYGSGGQAAGQNPSTWLTVGTGSDGAGNITGVGMPRTQHGASTTASTNTTSLVGASYSTSSGTVTILTGINATGASTSSAGIWCVSRTCSSLGVTSGDGVTVSYLLGTGITSPRARGAIYSPATQFAANPGPGVGIPSGNASVSGGGNIQLFRQFAHIGILMPSLGAIAYIGADVVANTIITAAPFGATTHNYLALGTTVLSGYDSSNNFTNITAAMLWE